MTDTQERAQRIADAVLTAKPPAPAGSATPSQAEEALAPIRQLMLNLQAFLIILVMVGSLCTFIWGSDPSKQLYQTQQERVYRSATFSFH